MIVVAGAADAEALGALHARAFVRPWAVPEIARLLDNPTAFALMATDSAPAGFVMAWVASGEAEVLTLAVLPKVRRRGIGVALVTAAAGVAAARGAEAMYLEVAEDNVAARALYAKLGFAESGLRRGYYSGGENAVVMRRALPL